jgi:AcrR family transcriptional regulator
MNNKNKLEKKASKHREKQKTETRDLILLSAGNLFEKLGFAGTTMRAVAGEAEMGYGTIFKHFTNKTDLLAACLYEGIEKALTDAFNTLPDDTSFENQFLHIAGKLIRHYAERPSLSKTYIENILIVDGTWKKIMDSQIEQFLFKLEEMIQTAKNNGEIRKEVDNSLLSLSLFSSYLSVLSFSLRAEVFDPDETIRKLGLMINLNLNGVLVKQT